MQQVAGRFSPRVFDVRNRAEAAGIILTPNRSQGTDVRWALETPYLVDLFGQHFDLKPESLVLDYGCGIGRMAEALITRTGCRVIGCDISLGMQKLAIEYVESPRFTVVAPPMLDYLVAEQGLRFDAALSVWVLQHCAKPAEDIGRIRASLAEGGAFFCVNEQKRFVPTDAAPWIDDGLNIAAMLDKTFEKRAGGALEAEVVTVEVSQKTFWGVYR